MAYTPDFCPGGMTADSVYASLPPTYYHAFCAFDEDEDTRWSSTHTSLPHWIRYDLGEGMTKAARKLRLLPFKGEDADQQISDFKLQGSNVENPEPDGDVDWTTLLDKTAANTGLWQEWEFENQTGFRYYRIKVTDTWEEAPIYPFTASIREIELMEVIGGGGESKFNRSLN